MDFIIEELKAKDYIAVANIYKQGIDTKLATFNTQVATWEDWDASHIKTCRFVAKKEDKVLGWVALSNVSSRCAYKGIAEVSIYISNDSKGMGIGEALLNKVIDESEKQGFWTLKSVIIRENTPSINLHKKCGFKEVGISERIAVMEGIGWMDVITVEKRSAIVGCK